MKLKNLTKALLIGAVSATLMSGCASMRNMVVSDSIAKTQGKQDPEKVQAFEDKFTKVLDNLGDKDDYEKLPLDGSDDLDWFLDQSYRLWEKKQTKEQYISNGEKKFPKYTKTLQYLANEFNK